MNDTLARHVAAMQTIAQQLENLAVALSSTICHHEREDVSVMLVDAICDLARELDLGLDSASLRAAENCEG